MGKLNSSITRVVPIFDRLFCSDPSGGPWLARLLKMGSRAGEVSLSQDRPSLVSGSCPTWGKAELGLPAPLSLLEHLVKNITPEQVAKSRDTGYIRDKRDALSRRDAGTIAEALGALRRGSRHQKWYVLEGSSKPDVTLETDDAILVVEGKRTERSCTAKTKWMESRSQLVRHMDAAIDFFPGKRVLGLLLVEGDGDADAIMPSQHWIDESESQYEAVMLASSLPHRSPSERSLLAAGIFGVATWQALCAQNSMAWPPVQDALVP